MKLFARRSSRWNTRMYYLGTAFIIVSLSISEFLLSQMFVAVVNDDKQPSIYEHQRMKVLNGINRAKQNFHKKRAKKDRNLQIKKQRVETNTFCPFCRFNYVNKKTGSLTCGKKIINDWNFKLESTSIEFNSTFREAAILLANDESINGTCRRCDPKSCSKQDKTYYRIDDVAPAVSYAMTHYLQSIPAKHRIPNTALKNLTAYFSDESNVRPNRTYFFEFNPSIVQIPKSQKVIENATYLASFRVSTCHDCVPNETDYIRMMNGPRSTKSHTEYLGLAILDSNLNILQELVATVKPYIYRFQDPRLFVLNDQLYVGSYHSIRPIWLSPPGGNLQYTGRLYHVWHDDEISKNRIMNNVTIGTIGICSNDRKTQSTGKNLNFFVDARNDTILEVQPMGPYERMNMSSICNTQLKTKAVFIQHNEPIPYPTFGTTDELDLATQNYYDAAYTDERGSACCVSIQHPDGRKLRLGISHSKTFYRSSDQGGSRLKSNQYFSSFYAFEADPPYKVVARSGKFCFGFPSDSERENPYIRMQMDSVKLIDFEYNSCPRIHFVSGMVEKADDKSKLIIAYGVNDCVPRMVVIDKADVLRMLFAPYEMAIGTSSASTSA
jgi:hypothetical protein